MRRFKRMIAVALLLGAMLAASSVEARELDDNATRRGQIKIVGRDRDAAIDQQLAGLLALGVPEPLSSTAAPSSTPAAAMNNAVTPAVKANIKRIYFKNNCSCSESSSAPYPLVAISYKPVQSADFMTIGFWSVTGCGAKYLFATTHDVIGIYAELTDRSFVWSGSTALTVYVPSQDKCAGRRNFAQYDLPLNWQDHTVYLNCN